MNSPLLKVEGLSKYFRAGSFLTRKAGVQALTDVGFTLEKGETLAIVGESGCGKTTLARCLLGIEKPSAGRIELMGKPLERWPRRALRQQIQMIFQDPYGSLNPRKRAWEIIAEPIAINTSLSKSQRFVCALEMMKKVGLRPELAERYPHMLSGGQRQRLGIARALMLKPRIIVCDEPVSALDVSIQAQILNLLLDLQDEFQLSYLFISHDLSVVRHVANRVLVIFGGKIVESGSSARTFSDPEHPYTKTLLASVPALAL